MAMVAMFLHAELSGTLKGYLLRRRAWYPPTNRSEKWIYKNYSKSKTKHQHTALCVKAETRRLWEFWGTAFTCVVMNAG